jgi:3-hydroxyisobutyrate dehydrogenase-like beta-hydroxyacid dehydrogenase
MSRDMDQSHIAIIGLGAMGSGLAARLLDLGHRVSVYNRTSAATDPFVARGARRAASPAEAAEPGGIAITMVSNDTALEAVTLEADGVLGGLGKDGLHISMSTVSAGVVRRLVGQHEAAGSHMVCAPVFGRGVAAASGKLWIAVAGADVAKARARPLLEQLSQGLFDFGATPDAAVTAKIAGNFLIVAATEAMAEAFALLQKNGVDPRPFHEMMSQSIFASVIYQNYGPLILDRKFSPPGFKLGLAAKDIGLVIDAATESCTPLPLVSLVRDRLMAASANGQAEMDLTAMAMQTARDAGLSK